MENPKPLNSRKRRFSYKVPIIGGLVGLICSGAIFVYCILNPPEKLFDTSDSLRSFVSIPTDLMLKPFGKSLELITYNGPLGPTPHWITPSIWLVIVTNTITCFVLSAIFELFRKV